MVGACISDDRCKIFRAAPLRWGGGFDPDKSFLCPTCYCAKFRSSGTTLPAIELSVNIWPSWDPSQRPGCPKGNPFWRGTVSVSTLTVEIGTITHWQRETDQKLITTNKHTDSIALSPRLIEKRIYSCIDEGLNPFHFSTSRSTAYRLSHPQDLVSPNDCCFAA